MNKLIVWLPAAAMYQPPERLQCWQLAPDAAVQQVALSVADIAQAKPTQLLVVVPVAALSWHQVQLPATVKVQGDARLQAVLHSLLEDALLDEVEQMHLALQPHAQPGHVALVAACEKAWLGSWLAAFEAAGVKVAQIVPEVAPDRFKDFAVCTEQAHSAWLNYMHQGLPLSMPVNSEVGWIQTVPACYALPHVFKEAAHYLGGDKVQLWSDSEQLQWMLGTEWDLAQHGFASNTLDRMRRKVSSVWQDVLYAREWRAARIGVAALAAVMVVGLNTQLWMQQRVLASHKAAVVQTAQSTFPRLVVVVDAPLQMQREVEVLRQAAGLRSASDFQPLAAAAGAALKAQGLSVTAVDFGAGELLLRGMAPSPQQMAAFNDSLLKNNYLADMAGDVVRVRAMP